MQDTIAGKAGAKRKLLL